MIAPLPDASALEDDCRTEYFQAGALKLEGEPAVRIGHDPDRVVGRVRSVFSGPVPGNPRRWHQAVLELDEGAEWVREGTPVSISFGQTPHRHELRSGATVYREARLLEVSVLDETTPAIDGAKVIHVFAGALMEHPSRPSRDRQNRHEVIDERTGEVTIEYTGRTGRYFAGQVSVREPAPVESEEVAQPEPAPAPARPFGDERDHEMYAVMEGKRGLPQLAHLRHKYITRQGSDRVSLAGVLEPADIAWHEQRGWMLSLVPRRWRT